MVSLQAHGSPNSTRKTNQGFDNISKKRKLEEIIEGEETFEKRSSKEGEETFEKRSSKAAESSKSNFDIELHLETPLPLEWERCLDIQSGEIHFYNTRTQTKTTGYPRESTEPSNAAGHMSLDLELNLPCDSQRKNQTSNIITRQNSVSPSHRQIDLKKSSSDLSRRPSWLAFEGEQQQQEMVATACMRCHMLVMLFKSSPTCPNCKFLHPADQSPPKLFKQRLSPLVLCRSNSYGK